MCEKKKGLHNRTDKCMKILIKMLNAYFIDDIKIVACCCGHNKYPMTVVIKSPLYKNCFELFTEVDIPRKRKFYVKDKQGYYYIPEVNNER
jgi:hypothetical protein